MKNIKKILTFIMVTTLFASLFSTAYAKNDKTGENGNKKNQTVLSEDVQTLIELGLLLGDGKDGVTFEYSKSKPTRIQAFIVYLRLMNESQKFEQYTHHEDDDNFDDHHGHSGFVKKGMAFAKAHPEYNWIGANGKFNPMAHLTAREYAKVLLTALGYEANVDFTWTTVESVAEKLGLNVPEGAFTFEQFATMTVQALNLYTKGSTTQKLIDRLDLSPITDTTKPTVTDLVLTTPYNAGPPVVKGQVTVYFSEAMKTDTLKNLANYDVDLDGTGGNAAKLLSLIPGATAVPSADRKSVTLTILDSTLNGGAAAGAGITTITISGLQDLAGNLIDSVIARYVRKEASLTVTENPAAIAVNKLQLTFSNPMETIDTTEFKLFRTDGTTLAAVGTGYTIDTTGKIVTITLDEALTASSKAIESDTTTAKLAIGTANTKDIFGNPVSGAVAVATPATITIVDKIAPVIIARDTQDLDKDGHLDAIKLTFNKNIKDSTVTAGDFDAAGYVSEAFVPTIEGDTADNNVIYIIFTESTAADTGLTPTIAYTQGTLEDTAGNKLATTGAVAATDKAAPAVITALPVGTLTAGGIASSAVLELSEDLTAANMVTVAAVVSAQIAAHDLVTAGDISWTIVWTTSRLLTVSITADANGGTNPDNLVLSAAETTLIDAAGNTAAAAQVIK